MWYSCKLLFLAGLASLFFICAPALANPPLPTIPSAVFYVTNYGAVGDGVTNNAVAIQAAITAANSAGGGTVEITAASSNYMCGPLTMKNSINLQVDSGAVLQMLPYSNWPGTTAFINGNSLHDVEISGSGIIDGNAHFGANDWWGLVNGSPVSSRPNFINFGGTTRILIQNITLQNPPTFHMMLKGNNSNLTIQGITINTPGNSPNTDGMDLGSTNVLIQNCNISDGDDNIEIGGSSAKCTFMTITNCTFGTGHGVSIGSDLQAGVSNVTVINCSFTGTVNGIRLKSDNDRGGVVQNISYYNITMTNVSIPLQICSYYDTVSTPDNVTPQFAAAETVSAVVSTTPIWRNITFSNFTINSPNSKIGSIVWSRTELPATNIFFSNIKMTASNSFQIYNARGVTVADSQFNFGTGSSMTCYNAQVTVTNSSPVGVPLTTLDGLTVTTNSTSNTFQFYNALEALSNTNVLGTSPTLGLSGTTLTVSNNLTLANTAAINFILGSTPDTIAVKNNLNLGGTINISAGAGFTNGSYTLFTYQGVLTWNNPVLGATPAGYNCALNTNTPGQIILTSAVIPSLAPVTLMLTPMATQLQLSWSSDHIGWHVEIQTNSIGVGLSSNWTTFAGSSQTNLVNVPISANNGSVFLRLKYP